jgi:hypothetical protein
MNYTQFYYDSYEIKEVPSLFDFKLKFRPLSFDSRKLSLVAPNHTRLVN